ncbi:MAG: protein-disulfide reductase DsbD [Gammaproteobacteria bacterium]|nr:protein-disulfide reductase DsbD [Gammaproteobacteria bacterium]
MVNRFHALFLSFVLCAWLTPATGGGILDRLDQLSAGQRPQRVFLPSEEVFVFSHEEHEGAVTFRWEIAEGYYLYRDKMQFTATSPEFILGAPVLPPSEPKDDAEFGRVEIYRGTPSITMPVSGAGERRLRVTYQGCAEDGICYPPIKKNLGLTSAGQTPVTSATSSSVIGPSATDRIADELATRSLSATVGWFFVAGLALALTPCVFPMIPILSGIIVGQRQPVTPGRSFVLALIYVLAMAATYAMVGLVAGLFGRNLQALFQHPAVLVGFSAVFVGLALAMFGFFQLQVPSFIQSRAAATSRRQAGGSLVGVGMMGVLSAIIVGPCVAPPLAAALLYLSHQGSPVVGGLALFALGMGMGAPLLVLGASAGRLIPRAGAWMEPVKQAFGVAFLGLAIWFLERIVPPSATLALWAALLVGVAVYLGALEPLRDSASGWTRFLKGLGMVSLCYGIVLLVGAAAGAEDPLRPLAPLTAKTALSLSNFAAVKGVQQFDLAVTAARTEGKPVILDFYADWCLECKRLERNTFNDPIVQKRLEGFVLLRADVTAVDAADNALLHRFDLLGPPAVLFFNAQGEELRNHRLIGYLDPIEFGAVLASVHPR